MARFDLTDKEWSIINPLLPNKPRGVPRVDDRRVVNGIFPYAAHRCSLARPAGALWPLHDGLQSLQPLGQGWRVVAHLRGPAGALARFASSDRHLDRARPSACCGRKKGGPDHAIGRSRGGLSTKIHSVVDANGLPIRLLLSPGQASDKVYVAALLAGLEPADNTVADRGYDARGVLDLILSHGSTPHIPTQRDRKVQRSVDAQLYRQRNLVERFFNKLKQFRRVATRYDKLARNFLAAVTIASCRIWIRHNESTA